MEARWGSWATAALQSWGGGREVQSEGNGDLIQEGGGCILVRGRCMGRGGLRITSRGEAYVPDSKDEDDNMEMEDMAMEGEADVMVPATRSATVVRPGRAMVRAADGVPCIEATADGPPDLELAPEVQARLQEVLAASIQCTMTSSLACTRLWFLLSSDPTTSFVVHSCVMLLCFCGMK